MNAYFIKEGCLERVERLVPSGYAMILNGILICDEAVATPILDLLDNQLGYIKHDYLSYINSTFTLGYRLQYTYRLTSSKGISSLTVIYCDGDKYIDGFEGAPLLAESHPDFWELMMDLADAIRVPKLEMARFMWDQEMKFVQDD